MRFYAILPIGVVIGFWVIALIIYFLPSLIALFGNKESKIPIFILNLLFGATIIGWILALIWALKSKKVSRDEKRLKKFWHWYDEHLEEQARKIERI